MTPFMQLSAGLGLALVLALVWGGWEHGRYVKERDAFAEFRGGVEALGRAAAERAAMQEKMDKLLKEKTDATYGKTVSDLRVTVKRLRDEADARGSGVPASPASSSRPDLACFDRTELSTAFGTLVGGLRKLADEGDTSAIALDAAKAWAAATRQ